MGGQAPVQAEKMCMGPCGAHHASGNTLVDPNSLDTHPFPVSDVSDEREPLQQSR